MHAITGRWTTQAASRHFAVPMQDWRMSVEQARSDTIQSLQVIRRLDSVRDISDRLQGGWHAGLGH